MGGKKNIRHAQIEGLFTTLQNCQNHEKKIRKLKNYHWTVETRHMTNRCNVASLPGFWCRKYINRKTSEIHPYKTPSLVKSHATILIFSFNECAIRKMLH